MKQARTIYSELDALFVVALISLAAYLLDYFLGNTINRDVLLVLVAVSAVMALFRYPRLLLFMVIATLTVSVNLPEELTAKLGLSRVVLMTSLAFLVFISLLNYAFILLPTGDKKSKMDTLASRKAVLKAVMESNLPRLARLMELNVELNFNHYGAVPILIAAEKGNDDIVLILAKNGADFSVRNDEGKTPLEIALSKGFSRVAEIIHYAAERKPSAAK